MTETKTERRIWSAESTAGGVKRSERAESTAGGVNFEEPRLPS
jgi:hypothetical protein